MGVLTAGQGIALNQVGSNVEVSATATSGASAGTIYSLIWNAAATSTNKYQIKDGSVKPSIGTFFYTGPTDPTTVGIIMNPGDEWRQTF